MVCRLLLFLVIQVKKRDKKNPAQSSAFWIYHSLINSTLALTSVCSTRSLEITMTYYPENRPN